jgi:hypothetical protein
MVWYPPPATQYYKILKRRELKTRGRVAACPDQIKRKLKKNGGR